MKSLLQLVLCGIVVWAFIALGSNHDGSFGPSADATYNSKFAQTAARWAHSNFADPTAEVLYAKGDQFTQDGEVYRRVTVRGRNALGGYVAKEYALQLFQDGSVVSGFTDEELKFKMQRDAEKRAASAKVTTAPPRSFRDSVTAWLKRENRNPSIELIKMGPEFHLGDDRYRLCILRAPTNEGGTVDKKFFFEVAADKSVAKAYAEDDLPSDLKPVLASASLPKWQWEKK